MVIREQLQARHMAGAPAMASASSPAIAFYKDTGKQMAFAAGARTSIDLPLGMVYRELYIRLSGQLTCTGANNIAANMFNGDEWALLSDIVLRQNGRDVLKRLSGAALRWFMYYWYGVYPKKSLFALGDGATANPAFDSTLIIPFWMPKSVRPMDFALDTTGLSRLDLEVAWGNYVNINSAATGFTVAPTLRVYVNEVTNVSGVFSRWNIFPIPVQPAGAQARFQVVIPVGYLYRSFLINDASAIIQNMYVESGPTQWSNIPTQILDTIIGNDRRSSQIATSLTNTRWLCGAPNDDAGHWLYFDQVSDGFNSESLDTYGLSEFYLYFDVAGAGVITIYPSQLVVPRS